MNFAIEQRYAGFLLRLCAFCIDTLILSAALFVLQLIFSIPMNFGVGRLPPMTPAIFGFNLISLVGVWLYYALFESSKWQATLGKRLFKIKVVDYNSSRISFLRATGRYFAKFLSTLILFIGYFMIIFTKKKQGLHDMIAETLVIRE